MGSEFDDLPNDNVAGRQPPSGPVDLGNVDDLVSTNAPAAQFKAVGTIIRGTIVSAKPSQQRDLATGKPKFWDDGRPCVQVLIVLATENRSADIDDDDGHRTLYVKKPSALLTAIAKALGNTKLSQSIGGTLAVKYTGDGIPSQRGFNAPKMFAAKFTPANGALVGGDTFTAPTQHANPVLDAPAAHKIAWEEFKAKTVQLTKEQREGAWRMMLEDYAAGTMPSSLSAQEWNGIAKRIRDEYGAANDAPGADDDIPF